MRGPPGGPPHRIWGPPGGPSKALTANRILEAPCLLTQETVGASRSGMGCMCYRS